MKYIWGELDNELGEYVFDAISYPEHAIYQKYNDIDGTPVDNMTDLTQRLIDKHDILVRAII